MTAVAFVRVRDCEFQPGCKQGRIEFNSASKGLDGLVLPFVGLLLYTKVKPRLRVVRIAEYSGLVLQDTLKNPN